MDENNLKNYTVMVGSGSGVLFQPTSAEMTYILTAKHLFYDTVHDDRGLEAQQAKKTIEISYPESQNVKHPLEIKFGENYYEHEDPKVDAAILLIDNQNNYSNIYADEMPSHYADINLTGYPESKRALEIDRYNKYKVADFISSTDYHLNLRLSIAHLAHRDISGFSGGGLLKINKDSLILIGIQSRTPMGDCHGEIMVTPIKRFNEIIEKHDLPLLFPRYLSKIEDLIDDIIKLDETSPELKPKIKWVLSKQLNEVKLNLIDVYKSAYIESSCTSNLNKKTKQFWTSFLEYVLIISLYEEDALNEAILEKVIRQKKFMFSDSDKGFYAMFSEILVLASDDIENDCQLLIGSYKFPGAKKMRRVQTKDIPRNITAIDEGYDLIDRAITISKVKELIHLKAIEFDCINENEDQLNSVAIQELLNELKKIVNEFFTK